MGVDEMLQMTLDRLNKINTAPDQKKLLDTAEAAEILKVKPQTMSLWRTKGEGPSYVKVGSGVRYLQSALNDYIDKNTVSR